MNYANKAFDAAIKAIKQRFEMKIICIQSIELDIEKLSVSRKLDEFTYNATLYNRAILQLHFIRVNIQIVDEKPVVKDIIIVDKFDEV